MRLWMGGISLLYGPFVLQASVCIAPGRSSTLFLRIPLVEARPDGRPELGVRMHRRLCVLSAHPMTRLRALSFRVSTRLAPIHTTTLRFS